MLAFAMHTMMAAIWPTQTTEGPSMKMKSDNHTEFQILKALHDLGEKLRRPVVAAIDGESGAGKSTLSAKLTAKGNVALITLDDFYQTKIPEVEWTKMAVEDRLNNVFDWKRVRSTALDPLRSGKPGEWHAFDFLKGLNERGTYDLKDEVTRAEPSPIIVIEGAYSASPHLRDLIDLTILVQVPKEDRHNRVEQRERDSNDFLNDWHVIWDEVEALYFGQICPPSSFDIVVEN